MPGTVTADASIFLDDRQSAYLHAVLHADRHAAMAVAQTTLLSGDPTALYDSIIEPVMREIGRLWKNNCIAVAREQMAVSTTQYVLAQVYSQHRSATRLRGKAVVTGIEGEFHQLGAHMAADILDFDGWDVRFLGANVPQDDIMLAIDTHKARLVGLSATMLFSTSKLSALIEQIKRLFPSTRILVGGSLVVNRFIDPVEMGADAGAASSLQGREIARGW